MTKKTTAKDFLTANPKATYEQFLAGTGLKKNNYYQARSDLGLSKTIKVAKRKAPEVLHVTGTKEPSQQSILYKRMCNMENEMRGLRTVISYLEHQLGLKQSAA